MKELGPGRSYKSSEFPDDPSINATVKVILMESSLIPAKLILADLQFKLKEFDQAYETLINNNVPPSMLLDFGKDLVTIKEYVRAEKVLTKIIHSTNNDQIITQTVFEVDCC